MTEESLKAQVSIANNATLKAVYEHCCEEYGRRLCEIWDFDKDYVWWTPTGTYDFLVLNDHEIIIREDEVRLLVDYNIPYKDFMEYYEFQMYHNNHCPSARHWLIDGYRPKNYERKDNTDEK